MINVQCSRLEEVRKNHSVFVQQLLSNQKPRGGRGMLQAWQSKVKAIHVNTLNIEDALKELQQSFMGFADNAINRKRQEFLIERFYEYFDVFNNNNLSLCISVKVSTLFRSKLSSPIRAFSF